MNLYKNFLKVDLAAQVLLLGIVIAFLIIGLSTGETDFFAKSIGIEGILGFWQVASAFLIGTIYKNIERWKYLRFVFLYMISLVGLTIVTFNFSDTPSNILIGFMLILIPMIFAFWYLFRTYADLKGILNRPRSFWDLT